MSILVISDIHGSHKCLETVLNTPHLYDSVIVVGDCLYHGPRNPILDDYSPGLTAELLNSISKPIVAVRGNCDAEVDQMLLSFSMMQDYSVMHHLNRTFYITHGHLLDPAVAYQTHADFFISGHTHLPGFNQVGSTLCLNPGSPSLPKGGHPATYAVINEDSIIIYDLDHNEYLHHAI